MKIRKEKEALLLTEIARLHKTAAESRLMLGQAVSFTAKFTSSTITVMGTSHVYGRDDRVRCGSTERWKGDVHRRCPAGANMGKVIYKGNSNIAGSSAGVTQIALR